MAHCPFWPQRVILVSFTDTQANWDQTVEHCANVFTGETTNADGLKVRRYAVVGTSGMATVTFYRPIGMPVPTGHSIDVLAEGVFTLPAN